MSQVSPTFFVYYVSHDIQVAMDKFLRGEDPWGKLRPAVWDIQHKENKSHKKSTKAKAPIRHFLLRRLRRGGAVIHHGGVHSRTGNQSKVPPRNGNVGSKEETAVFKNNSQFGKRRKINKQSHTVDSKHGLPNTNPFRPGKRQQTKISKSKNQSSSPMPSQTNKNKRLGQKRGSGGVTSSEIKDKMRDCMNGLRLLGFLDVLMPSPSRSLDYVLRVV
jgi:hypothetical protein